MKFLVGTLCGGLMEDPELYIQPPYLIIDAKSKGEAINRYNGKTHAHFFYGGVIARINNDKLEEISKYVSEKQAYDIYNELLKIHYNMNTENLNELKYKAYHCAVAHGWHEEDLSNEHFLCLVISELMEAMEADRKGMHAKRDNFEYYMKQRKRDDGEFMYVFKLDIKDSVEDELADVCIRLLDLAGLRNCELLYMDRLYIQEISFTEFSYMFCSFITNPDKSQNDWLKLHISCSLGRIFSWCRAKT